MDPGSIAIVLLVVLLIPLAYLALHIAAYLVERRSHSATRARQSQSQSSIEDPTSTGDSGISQADYVSRSITASPALSNGVSLEDHQIHHGELYVPDGETELIWYYGQDNPDVLLRLWEENTRCDLRERRNVRAYILTVPEEPKTPTK